MIFHEKNNAGYTLLEISLTISIGILILLAATPTVGSYINERRLRNVANVILESASEARIAAKEQGKTVFLLIKKGEIQTPRKERKSLPQSMKLFLKTGTSQWTVGEKNWAFFSGGIVEPLSFRLERGSSWIEMDIDPLTGLVSEERFSF